jgi:quinol monooxygenase YgiN
VVVAIANVYAKVPQRDVVEQALRDAQSSAGEQDGCMTFAFAEVVGDPGHFLVVERWRDRSALDEHYRSASFASYQAAIRHQLVRDSDLDVHVVSETIRPFDLPELDLDQDD